MPKLYPELQKLVIGLLTVILTACAAPTKSPPTPTAETESVTVSTASPVPSKTPSPTSTAVRTPPALPDSFFSDYLHSDDIPQAYIENTCEYLKNRWTPGNAAPGTVVMIVMLNDIVKEALATSTDGTTAGRLEHMFENITAQGFEAINTEQLSGFLESNQYIPPRSVLFLQEGRRTAGNFEQNFRDYRNRFGWPVVNGWTIHLDSPDNLIEENLALEKEGFVDHQLYSPLQRFGDNASEEFLSTELMKYTIIFEERFGKAPIAITWPSKPGVNFIKAARDRGFQLGFTQNSRGPVMYNWIPLASRANSDRPAYYPENSFDDPLMTLPRYWPSKVVESLDQIRLTGKLAAAYAEENKEIELEYYDIVCAPEYGEITDSP